MGNEFLALAFKFEIKMRVKNFPLKRHEGIKRSCGQGKWHKIQAYAAVLVWSTKLSKRINYGSW